MKRIILFVVSICTLVSFIFVGCKDNDIAPQDKYFNVTYLSDDGGYIMGENNQSIKDGGSTTLVEAIPHEGYVFVEWSDGIIESSRIDTNVKSDISVAAQFTKIIKTESTFTLDFRTADTFDIEQTLTLKNSEIFGTQLPVPNKEHFTFNGWYIKGQDKNKCITDANGVINKFVKIDSTVLMPSWTANETFTYKILMVYVTEIHAELQTRIVAENRTKEVNYLMTETEKQFCHVTTQKVKEYLDDIMDGLVEFEIDEYFTTQPIVTDNFTYGYDGYEYRNASLFADSEHIPEVKDMVDEYDSVIAAYSLNDFDGDFNDCAGKAKVKYGQAFLDRSPFYGAKLNGVSLKSLINNTEHHVFKSWLDTIVHELAHTIELKVNSYDYHKCISELGWNQRLGDDKYVQKLYYTGSVIMEGKKVGINYSFWSGTTLKVRYEWTEGGYVNFKEQEVLYGGDTFEAVATAFKGYRFVQWSDGVTDIRRTEKSVTSDITIKAIFEKID